jgi:HEAT repeat protein
MGSLEDPIRQLAHCGNINSENMGAAKSGFAIQGSWRARCFLRGAALAFLSIAMAVVAASQETSSATPSPTPTPAVAPATPPPTPAAVAQNEQPTDQGELVYKFVSGHRTVYQVSYVSDAHADFRALFQTQGRQLPADTSSLVYALNAQLRGQWVATVLNSEAGRVHVIYELHEGEVRVTVNGQEQTGQAESVRNNLSRGVLVDMTPEGRVLAVCLDPDADKFSRDFALSLFGISEFVLPAAADIASWQTREEDRTGIYLARYQAVTPAHQKDESVPGPVQRVLIRKSKLHYSPERNESTLPGQTPAQKTVVPSGTLEARFDPALGQLVSLSGTDVQDTIITGKNVAHSASTLHLTRLSGKEVPAEDLGELRRQAQALAAKGLPLPLYTRISPEEMQSSIQRTQLGSETLDSLLQQLSAVATLKDKSDQTDLYLKFKALVYLHPESCARLGTILSTADAQSPTFVILARALGSVGNAQAQDALIAAIQARSTDLVAVSNLIPTLAEAPAPTVKAEETIRELSNHSADANISATALLSLGTMAHGLAKKSPARSQRIVHDLLQQARHTQTQDRTHDLIEALGNTQSAEALPALASFARNPEARLRAAALDALRFMPAPRADALLLSGLDDSDGAPRLEAAYALSFRKMTTATFAAQKKALLADDNEKVRAALLANLWKDHAKFPEARKLVETAANQDPSDYVRKVAREMLLQSP